MNHIIKYIISIIGIILAVSSIVFGSILPLMKSRSYIAALYKVSSIKTIDDFKANFDPPLNFYSPIGQEEVVKFLSRDILATVAQGQQSELASRALISYIEPLVFKNDVRHLLATGQMYAALWQSFGKDEDFLKTEEYYLKALAIGPKLPPVLYGLFEFYAIRGDREKAKEIGEIILNYWPNDEKTKEILDAIK